MEGYCGVTKRIAELMEERGWTRYELAKRSGLSSSTIDNIFKRSTVPSILTLEPICKACGITLSEFFAEVVSDDVEMKDEELLASFKQLEKREKDVVQRMIVLLSEKKR